MLYILDEQWGSRVGIKVILLNGMVASQREQRRGRPIIGDCNDSIDSRHRFIGHSFRSHIPYEGQASVGGVSHHPNLSAELLTCPSIAQFVPFLTNQTSMVQKSYHFLAYEELGLCWVDRLGNF